MSKKTRTMYDNLLAESIRNCAGKSYVPSNGTEGECFFETWCEDCTHAGNIQETGQNECDIPGRAMLFRIGESGYPAEWVYGNDGQPSCTKFTEATP